MNQNTKQYFKLFASCIPVKGYFRSLICDLQNRKIHYITNLLYEVIKVCENCELKLVKKLHNNEIDKGIDVSISYFVDKGWGFITDSPDDFPDLPLIFYCPYKITNVILEINNNSSYITSDFYLKIDKLGCEALEIRWIDRLDLNLQKKLLIQLSKSQLKSIIIYYPFSAEFGNKKASLHLLNIEGRIKNIVIHSSPFSYSKRHINDNSRSIDYIVENLDYSADCGYIGFSAFFSNYTLFSESQDYNTCLNRKLTVNSDGMIKNCPSMKHHYGHISNTKLEDVVNLPEFQKWWHIKKDQIDVCKDCEFRHMCTDCRAFIKDPENIYSQPAKCPYNPYIAKWESEECYVPVEECGSYTRETGFVPDKKKIRKLNKQIWGE